MRRQVGNHGGQRGTKGTHVSRDGTTTRSRAFRSSLVGEARAGHVDEFLLTVVFDEVFDDLFLRVEGLEVVEAH